MGGLVRTLLLTLLLLSPRAHAEWERLAESWRWSTFGAEEGLASKRVTDVVDMPGDLVWAATARGMAWFDGYQWIPLTPDQGLPQEPVTCVLADRDTNLLVIQGRRLSYGNRAGFSVLPLETHTPAAAFVHGARLAPGRFLLLSSDGRLFLLTGKRLELLGDIPSLPQARLAEIRKAHNGLIWANSTHGLLLNDGTRWRMFLGDAGGEVEIGWFGDNARGDGAAWVIHPRRMAGLWTWERGGPPRHTVREPVPALSALVVGPRGEVIQIEESGRVSIRQRASVTTLSHVPVMLIGTHFAKLRPNGDVWIGGPNGLHLCRLTSRRWESWSHAGRGKESPVHDLLLRHDGSLWAATASGIEVHRNDGSSSLLTSANGLPLRVVTGLAEDADGAVWATSGFSFTGAVRWNGLRWQHFGWEDGLDDRLYHRVIRDRLGRLWFLGLETSATRSAGTSQRSGVSVYADGRFRRWGDDHHPLRRSTYTVGEGPDGTLWFGTNSGLSCWTKSGWRTWTTAEGLRSNRVFTLAVDKGGVVWFGDQSNGLGRLERDRVSYWTAADGLLDDAVWEVKIDEGGKLWVATRSGLTTYDGGTWARVGYSAGLTSTALWPVLPAGERIFLGTSSGGTMVLRPFAEGTRFPRVVFTPPIVEDGRVQVRWRALGWWGTDVPDGLETRYRLDGGTWSVWSDQDDLRIASVPAGNHLLQVQAKDRFGRYDPRGSVQTLVVELPMILRPAVFLPLALLTLAVILLASLMAQRHARHRRELRSLEETSRVLLDATPDVLYLLDASGKIVAMNQTARRMPGAPAAGSVLFDAFPGPIAASRRAAAEQVLSNLRPVILEDQYGGRHYEHSIHPVLNGSGKPPRLAMATRDITDRRQLEGTMRSTVQFLRQILESSTTIAIISTDRQGTILFWNTGASNLFGYPPEEMVGRRNLGSLLPAGDTALEEELMNTMMAVLGSYQTTVRVLSVVHKDGRIRKIRVTVSPQSEQGGMIQGMLVIGEDMTDQEIARRETEQAERQLRLLAFTLNCAKDAFVVTDLNNTILYVNQAFVDMYGYTEDELTGKSVMMVRSSANPPELSEQIRAGTRGAGWSGEVLNRRKNGEEFPVELWTSTVRNDQGEAVALVGVSREITERKRAEDQIRASLREKEVLLKEIHHRVKNNLQVITSLLNLQAGKIDNNEIQSILKESQTRVKSMALVHEELYQSDDLSRVDFADYIRRLTTNLFHTYQTGPVPISLLVDVEEIFLAVDTAIPCGLIINELVSNALRHAFDGRDGGAVTIRLQRDGAVHVLTVADDGIGLPEDIDPGSTETLGLQLVSTLTRQLGGVLTVTRERGTRFEIQFVEHHLHRAQSSRSVYGGQG